MERSTAVVLSIILCDAVKEFKILAGIVDIMRKKKWKTNVEHSEAEEFVISQMNKILKKYSYKYNVSLKDIQVDVLKEIQKSSGTTGYPSTATIIEDSFSSIKYTEKLLKEIFYLIDVLEKLGQEIKDTGKCETLQQSLDKEESEFKEIERILAREQKAREKIKEIKKKIEEKNEEGIKIIEQGKESIAHLKDQVQEMKAKIIMEEKYITRYSTVKLEEFQSQCDEKENEIKHQIEIIQTNHSKEERVHAEVTSYLNERISYLKNHEVFWQEKVEKNIGQLKQELYRLKDSKEKNLNKLNELSVLYKEYEAVILSDRIEKEKIRQQEEQVELELQAACKIQNWWRTVCVQHSLGPYQIRHKNYSERYDALELMVILWSKLVRKLFSYSVALI
uniref:Dynein regulatory complex protein 9 n=1 Tax=Trichobilharzia regenti TaxID=157069 RepID=A0AA85J9Q6_TRIRE|nr:unnamed protein product [Trichobilharzia regenti]